MPFTGYPQEALPFLTALPDRDPTWFKANRGDYETLIVGPTKALVEDLGELLREERPQIVAEPRTNGSIAPINNDRRFAPDRPPYKDHLLLRFWEGSPKKTAPTLFVRLAGDAVGFATGVVPADLDRWRQAVASDAGARLAEELDGLRDRAGAEVVGQDLKRVPAPYAADHPQAALLRHKWLQARWLVPLPASVHSGEFAGWCAAQLQSGLSVHRWLVAEL